ncbi:hypothetical protein L5515_005434 [Caenorhabditis briggsae]|uniref:F-box domain-containing protein n=1 Tax=Caenorhabditis briggsae TaxID=6238 RepID=A0AAE9EPB9_CAEBR|nr:hypothetical protein L5515_005434 [Caenorhabditis briggsae]
MPIFCCSFIFTSPEKRERESWGIIPENAQKHIIGYLNPREKAKFSVTCKKNYELVKNVKIPVYCLQFCPLRYNSKSAEILVNFDEENQNSYSFYFDRNGLNNSLKTTIKSNGLDCVYSPRGLEAEFRLMADLCFQGWVMGSKIELLDIRGDYNGKIPSSLELSTFSFSDKYNRANSAIPAWLDIIQENDNGINFMLMSDHWDKILGHEHFSNPQSTLKLTGYDGIGHENLENLNSKQIQMNNVKDEQGFNLLVKKWIFGGFADTFEWLIVTNVTRPLKTEKLLLDIKIRGLDGSIFEEATNEIQTNDSAEYFLIFGENGKLGIFCGIDNFAKFTVVNQKLLELIPNLEICLKNLKI